MQSSEQEILMPKFCPHCAGRLAPEMIDERERLVCQVCGFIFYINPTKYAFSRPPNCRSKSLSRPIARHCAIGKKLDLTGFENLSGLARRV